MRVYPRYEQLRYLGLGETSLRAGDGWSKGRERKKFCGPSPGVICRSMYGVCTAYICADFFLPRTPSTETGFIVDLHCRVVAAVAYIAVQIRYWDDNCYNWRYRMLEALYIIVHLNSDYFYFTIFPNLEYPMCEYLRKRTRKWKWTKPYEFGDLRYPEVPSFLGIPHIPWRQSFCFLRENLVMEYSNVRWLCVMYQTQANHISG